jgi:hypothetical protein
MGITFELQFIEGENDSNPLKSVFLNRRALASIIPGPRLIKKEFTGSRSHKV